MEKILVGWIGFTDIRASKGSEKDGFGPIGQAVKAKDFDEICLISNLASGEAENYEQWLRSLTESEIVLRTERLTGPTQFGEIYEADSSQQHYEAGCRQGQIDCTAVGSRAH
jgi:hypothetical protein